jgi:hypothetical protein
MKARVDYFHTGIPIGPGNYLDPPVVAVEPRLRHQYPNLLDQAAHPSPVIRLSVVLMLLFRLNVVLMLPFRQSH